MVILPLGLTARLKDIPWFSIAIVIITALWMFQRDEMHAYNRLRLNLPSQQQTEWLLRQVKIETCRTTLNPTECRYLEESVSDDKPQNYALYLGELHRVLKKAKADPDSLQRIMDFISAPPTNETAAQAAAATQKYFSAKEVSDRELTTYQAKHGILTRTSINAKSLLTAQFSHSGWMHLIGNLLVLLAFIVFIEQYLGPAKTAAIYFAGGFVGLALFLLTIDNEHLPLVGASANVFAMGGAFLVLFWRHKVRVLFSAFFVLNRQLLVPVWAYFAAFLLMKEMAGTFQAQLTSVAHGAHLGGFVVGAGLALLFTHNKKLPADIVYPYELDEMAQLKAEQDPKKRHRLLLDILLHNPGNISALRSFITEEKVQSKTWPTLPEGVRRLLAECVRTQTQRHLDQREWDALADLFAVLPRHWPSKDLLPPLSAFQIHRLEKELSAHARRAQLQILFDDREVLNASA